MRPTARKRCDSKRSGEKPVGCALVGDANLVSDRAGREERAAEDEGLWCASGFSSVWTPPLWRALASLSRLELAGGFVT